VFLMLAVGSVGGLVSGLFGVPWWWQLVIAAALSVLLLFTLRPPLLHALRRGGDPTPSNVDALLGSAGRVVLTTSGSTGQVKLSNGETWTARLAAGSTEPIVVGSPVIVIAIEGATAVVAPAETKE
jgi:membrane protein implicated in regulation of membrane protease activity